MRKMFEPCTLGGIQVRNRFVRSATMEAFAKNGVYDIEYASKEYKALSEGGVGCIITGMVAVDENSAVASLMPRTYDPSFEENFGILCKIVHENGAKIVAQISHCGFRARPDNPDNPAFAPSNMPGKNFREMQEDDFAALIKAFGQAALHCKNAGADGVQIHSAHGYLLSQMLTPRFNMRTDQYGGSIENRSRLLFKIYDEIRAVVGPDYPIWIKINGGEDEIPDGLTLEECKWICKELEKRGIDCIEVSGGAQTSDSTISKPVKETTDEAYFADRAEAISNTVSTDIISVGGYKSFEVCEERVNRGNIKGISMCRALICEPALIKQWQNGDFVKAKCVSCNGCFTVFPTHCKTFENKL